jgi:NYN domain
MDTSTLLQIDLQSLFVAPQKEKKTTVYRDYQPAKIFNRERINEERSEFINRETVPRYNLKSDQPKRLDFEKIWAHFKNRETEYLISSIIYTLRNSDRADLNYDRFETKIKSIGYELKIKTVSKTAKRYSTSQAVPIVIDCVSRSTVFDKWILMTNNNGEYLDLCKYLKGINKKIEIWSFKDNYDPVLEPYADKLHFIEDDFCMKLEQSMFVFGINWGGEELLSNINVDTTAENYVNI